MSSIVNESLILKVLALVLQNNYKQMKKKKTPVNIEQQNHNNAMHLLC
jgi:hypothetical protein